MLEQVFAGEDVLDVLRAGRSAKTSAARVDAAQLVETLLLGLKKLAHAYTEERASAGARARKGGASNHNHSSHAAQISEEELG